MSRLRPRLLDLLVLGPALALAFAVGWAWWKRWSYPYDLEWMEGGMLAHAWRLTQGLPLYAPAGPDWIPYVYPPGYAALLAALGQLFGLDYSVGRLLSIAGTALAAAACARVVVRAGGGLALAAGCMALFLGSFEASGAFFDLVRTDGVAMGLLGAAIAVGLERHKRAPEAAGLLLALAFCVKQHSAAYGLPMVLGIWARDGWRPAARFGASSAIPAAAFTLVMEAATGGRFLDYLLAVPASHPFQGERLFPGAPIEAARWFLGACLAAAAFLWLRAGPLGQGLGLGLAAIGGAALWVAPVPAGLLAAGFPASLACTLALGLGTGAGIGRLLRERRAPPWGWVYGGGIAVVAWVTTGLMRAHNGGFLNVLMPLHWVLAVAAGVTIARARRWRPGVPTELGGALLITAQVAWMLSVLDVEALVPRRGDREAGDAIVAEIAARCGEGPVLSPFAPWLAQQAGYAPSWHLVAFWDVNHEGGPFPANRAAVEAALGAHRWSCVIDGVDGQFGPLKDQYRLVAPFRLAPKVFVPKTGWRVRPRGVFLPAGTP